MPLIYPWLAGRMPLIGKKNISIWNAPWMRKCVERALQYKCDLTLAHTHTQNLVHQKKQKKTIRVCHCFPWEKRRVQVKSLPPSFHFPLNQAKLQANENRRQVVSHLHHVQSEGHTLLGFIPPFLSPFCSSSSSTVLFMFRWTNLYSFFLRKDLRHLSSI